MKLDQQFENKRILLLLPEVFGQQGGIQRFCRALCLAAGRWARREGAQVNAIVLNDRAAPDPRYVNGGFERFIPAGSNKAKFVSNYLRMLAGSPYDLVIAGHISLAPLTLLATTLNKSVKTAVIAYGVEAWRRLSVGERAALKRADAVLCISNYTGEELLKQNAFAADKIRILPCSLDPFWEPSNSLDYNGSSSRPMILSVVRLEREDRYKGIDNVIRSLPEVVAKNGPVDYRIVGAGNDLIRLKELAETLNVSPYVTFAGSLNDEDLRENYRRCSVFVMPSEREGFGIVFLEAMAHGKAVVGGAHGGTPSVVRDGETGLLVSSSDVAGLSNAISRLLSDKELRDRLGRAGHERLMSEFTFQKFESNLDEFLRSCLTKA